MNINETPNLWSLIQSAKAEAATPPVAGYGRTWQVQSWECLGEPRGGFVLISRAGAIIGMIAEYDNGWGANSLVRGKFRHVGSDGYPTAYAAGAALLKARRS